MPASCATSGRRERIGSHRGQTMDSHRDAGAVETGGETSGVVSDTGRHFSIRRATAQGQNLLVLLNLRTIRFDAECSGIVRASPDLSWRMLGAGRGVAGGTSKTPKSLFSRNLARLQSCKRANWPYNVNTFWLRRS